MLIIAPEQLTYIIEKAREFHAETAAVDKVGPAEATAVYLCRFDLNQTLRRRSGVNCRG